MRGRGGSTINGEQCSQERLTVSVYAASTQQRPTAPHSMDDGSHTTASRIARTRRSLIERQQRMKNVRRFKSPRRIVKSPRATKWMRRGLHAVHSPSDVSRSQSVPGGTPNLHENTCAYHTSLKEDSKKEKIGNPPSCIPDNTKHIYMYVVRGSWMPSLENWGGGFKIFCG